MNTYIVINALAPGVKRTLELPKSGCNLIDISASGKLKTIFIENNEIKRIGFLNHSTDTIHLDTYIFNTNTLEILNRDSQSQDVYVRIQTDEE